MREASRPRGAITRAWRSFAAAGLLLSLGSQRAPAATPLDSVQAFVDQYGPNMLVSLVLIAGVVTFGVTVAIQLVRTRRQAAENRAAARAEIAALRAETDRVRALLDLDPQILVVWGDEGRDPQVRGDLDVVGAAFPLRVLAFGAWLDVERSRELEAAVDRLRTRGEAFSMPLVTRFGRFIEADGRAIGGRAVLRLREVTGARREAAEVGERLRNAERDTALLRTLVDSLDVPLWVRDPSGRLVWTNAAYATAVEAKSGTDAITRNLELLDRADRAAADTARLASGSFAKRLAAVVAGERRMLDIREIATPTGASAGIALDATALERLQTELQRTVSAHRRTLDGLATGVAIFDKAKRLVFYNAAYRNLFALEPAFLDDKPSDPDILDRLRQQRKLPEEANFRVWRDGLLSCYQASEPLEHSWHLPGGRMLRVVCDPTPDGGMTYLFDDLTERIDLESRYNQLTGLHRETLDNLAEAVAVFGSDGRLKLHNPAFVSLWHLSPDALAEAPHVDTLAQWCAPLGTPSAWTDLRAAVTALGRSDPLERRIDRADGSALDASAAKLPDGSTLVTFRDISDSAAIERALTEKNQALEQMAELKSRFVRHVSYELRSPLTNIIGFAHLLRDRHTGPLNPRQDEYVDHITSSGAALLAIIDDILDLTTIDAGVMALDLSTVDVAATMRAAADGVQDRIADADLKLTIDVAPGLTAFTADAKRVRQVLYNLLSNAVSFSPAHGAITLAARPHGDGIEFSITDQGPGIPSDLRERVFERFESHSLGSSHRGAGLGLSIVRSLVALHGGEVHIADTPEVGTTVVVRLPAAQKQAAE